MAPSTPRSVRSRRRLPAVDGGEKEEPESRLFDDVVTEFRRRGWTSCTAATG